MASTPPIQEQKPEPSLVQSLTEIIQRGKNIAAKGDFPPGLVKIWIAQMRTQLRKAFGSDSQVERWWPIPDETMSPAEASAIFVSRLAKAQHLLAHLNEVPAKSLGAAKAQTIFIGHGRSPVWREFKDFLQDRLHLPWEEFNRESVAGIATTERLDHLLSVSTFAFLIMTAEDEHTDQTRHARLNVIHEVGLFQGKLGTRKAIILLEDGCQQFSNIHGLTHIPFPQGRISAAFEDIRKVLEREGVTES